MLSFFLSFKNALVLSFFLSLFTVFLSFAELARTHSKSIVFVFVLFTLQKKTSRCLEAAVLDVESQDAARANVLQPVHDVGDLFNQHHGRDRNLWQSAGDSDSDDFPQLRVGGYAACLPTHPRVPRATASVLVLRGKKTSCS